MRKIMLVIVFVFIIVFPLLASEVEADAKISRVVVYPGHALVTWSAKVSLTAGEWKVIFPNIIPNIDTNSLRAKGEGTAVTRILGAQLRQEILRDNPVERIKQLQDEIQNIEDQNRKLANNKEVLSQGKSFLDSIRLFSGEQIPKDLVTKVPSAQELENTLKFLDSKLKENYSLVLDTDLALRENQKKQSVLRRELSQISGPVGKTKRSIVVEIEVIKPGDLNLDVSYLAKGANWEPFYDVRANFDKGEVELISYGKLRQRSGEDWLDSEIYLSTAMINLSGRMPEAKSWIIQPQQPRAVLSKRKSYTEHEAYDKVFEVNKEVAIDSDGRAGSLAQSTPAENLYAQAQEKGVSVVYQIMRKATIKTDNTEHKLPISSQVLKADFEYSAFPRLSNNAYLRSKVSNSKDLQLLGGRVSVFLDEDYIGASEIDNVAPGEEFDLYLGVDENVLVKRELVEKKMDDTLIAGIPAPNRKLIYRYKITVENYKNKFSKISIFDSVPVSQDAKIKVKIDKVSLEPKEKNWKDKLGVWLWELGLEPKAKKEIFYTCTVEYPRDMQLEGVD